MESYHLKKKPVFSVLFIQLYASIHNVHTCVYGNTATRHTGVYTFEVKRLKEILRIRITLYSYFSLWLDRYVFWFRISKQHSRLQNQYQANSPIFFSLETHCCSAVLCIHRCAFAFKLSFFACSPFSSAISEFHQFSRIFQKMCVVEAYVYPYRCDADVALVAGWLLGYIMYATNTIQTIKVKGNILKGRENEE